MTSARGVFNGDISRRTHETVVLVKDGTVVSCTAHGDKVKLTKVWNRHALKLGARCHLFDMLPRIIRCGMSSLG